MTRTIVVVGEGRITRLNLALALAATAGAVITVAGGPSPSPSALLSSGPTWKRDRDGDKQWYLRFARKGRALRYC